MKTNIDGKTANAQPSQSVILLRSANVLLLRAKSENGHNKVSSLALGAPRCSRATVRAFDGGRR